MTIIDRRGNHMDVRVRALRRWEVAVCDKRSVHRRRFFRRDAAARFLAQSIVAGYSGWVNDRRGES